MAYSFLTFWFEIKKDMPKFSAQVTPFLQYMGNQGGKSMGEHNQVFKDVQDNYSRVISGQHKIKQASSWKKQIQNKTLKMSHNNDDGCLVMNISSDLKIAKVINLLAVIYEIDCYKKWVPYCKVSKKLGDINKRA
jgi:hypothetical protein